jgi:hypothetical protein
MNDDDDDDDAAAADCVVAAMHIDGIDIERDLLIIGCSFDDSSDENDEKPLDFVMDSLVCS